MAQPYGIIDGIQHATGAEAVGAMRFLLAAILFAASAGAQTFTSHNGWSFADTLQTATDVLVGDIVNGTGIDDGSQVTVKATLRVVRALRGATPAGAELPLQWQFRPMPLESPAIASKVPLVRSLWFLRKNAEGKLEPLRASGMLSTLGGFYLPSGDAPGYYTQNAPLQYKIACEIAPVLEELATRNAADLGPHAPEPPVRGVLAPWVQTRMRYQALTMALQALDKTATAEVYQRFSSLPDPNLKMVGIEGRLNAGDTSAVFDLEKNLASLAAASVGVNMPPAIMGLNLRGDLPAAHALARMALSQTPLSLEGGLGIQLAATRSPEFLPYLIVMLGSPNSGMRDGALMAFCQLLGPMGDAVKAHPLWRPGMSGYCPNGYPMNDRAAQEKDIQFWKQWWASNRDEIAKTVTLPAISAPARYSVPENTGWQEITEIPMEIRFMSLLNMSGAQPDHYHDAAGGLVESAVPGPHDPVSAPMTPSDREAYQQVVGAVNAKLAAVRKGSEDMLNAARIAETMPDAKRSHELNQQRMAALKAGLDELRNRLSPAGWQMVERFLMQMGIGMMAGGAPK
jgi:hypothetical protein